MSKTRKRNTKKQPPQPRPAARQACQIYLITPPVIEDVDAFASILERTLAAAPVAALQVRVKDTDETEIFRMCDVLRPICHAHDTLLILNDRPDWAEAAGADGVHIGQGDMDLESARLMLGRDALIGVTCHNSKDLGFAAASGGADYVAFGAFFDTPTKAVKYRAELELLEFWQEALEIPCVAIGGITPANAQAVIAAGADFIACSSGVWQYEHGPEKAVQDLEALCRADLDTRLPQN